jgi:hypothetical protein
VRGSGYLRKGFGDFRTRAGDDHRESIGDGFFALFALSGGKSDVLVFA